MLHYNTVMFKKSLGIFLQSIERSRKNITEKGITRKQENGITYMVFPFSFILYCEQIYTLFEKLPDLREKIQGVVSFLSTVYSKYRELLSFSFCDLSC